MRIRWSPEADADLRDIWHHVAMDNPRAADALLGKLADAVWPLADYPEFGRARPELAPGLRPLPVGSYVIYYKVDDRGVLLVRVLHGRRQLGADLFA